MLKSYEAFYENGQVKWLAEQPEIKSARVIVTILEEVKPPVKRRTFPLVAHCSICNGILSGRNGIVGAAMAFCWVGLKNKSERQYPAQQKTVAAR